MTVRVALAGNPNCGKTTMFNNLTGANQYVGNWPGVTVEKKEGKWKKNKEVIVTDLPGIYSLSPYTLEEVVSRDYLLKEDPDVIVNLVDATNIERNLYLTTQLMETGIPVVIALNMADLLEKRNIRIDTERLSMLLNAKIIETSALKGDGLDELMEEAVKVAGQKEASLPQEIFSTDMEKAIHAVEEVLPSSIGEERKRWYAIKQLENDSKVMESVSLSSQGREVVKKERQALETALDNDMESIVTDERYQFIQKIVKTSVKKAKGEMTISDKIDRIVTNRILGIPIFIAVMFVVYYVSVTTIGTIVTDWTNDEFVVMIQDAVGGFLTSIGTGDLVQSLVVEGIIGGVGAVLGFVPQMAILFLFLSILEDCGYMVRIAFVMDRVFRHFGLSGKSFIPLLISSGCGIPGIMASRTIEQENDRRLTIMTATFVPCGAKLPVIALMGGVMASYVTTGNYEAGGWIAPLMYFIGILAVLVSAIILKKTKPFSGKAGTVRHGTAAVSHPVGEDRADARMGTIERLYRQSGNDPVLGVCRHVVSGRIWFCGRSVWHGGRQRGQPAGHHRRCDRSAVRPAWALGSGSRSRHLSPVSRQRKRSFPRWAYWPMYRKSWQRKRWSSHRRSLRGSQRPSLRSPSCCSICWIRLVWRRSQRWHSRCSPANGSGLPFCSRICSPMSSA